jgi:hypothetical protein
VTSSRKNQTFSFAMCRRLREPSNRLPTATTWLILAASPALEAREAGVVGVLSYWANVDGGRTPSKEVQSKLWRSMQAHLRLYLKAELGGDVWDYSPSVECWRSRSELPNA